MGVSWGGLATGIERGLGLGLALDQNQQAKEDRIYTRGLQERQLVLSEASNERQIDSHEVNMAVANMELDEARDQKKRTRMLNAIYEREHATQMYQQNLKDGTYKTQAELQAATAQLNQGNLDLMNLVGNKLINKNNQEGERKRIGRMYPHAPSGKLLFELDIMDKDGNVLRKAPLTKGQSADPADPAALVAPEDLTKHMAKVKQILTDLDRMAIRRGDSGPIDRMRAGAEQTEERKYDAKVATLKHQRGLQTEAFKSGLKGGAGPTNSEYGSGEDALKDFFFKLDDNGMQVLEPDKAPDYALALSRLQTLQQALPNTPYGVLANQIFQEYGQLGDLESFRAQAAQELQGTGADASWWPGNQAGGGTPEAVDQRTQQLYNASRQNWLRAPMPGGQAGLATQGATGAAGNAAPVATGLDTSNSTWQPSKAAAPYMPAITAAEQKYGIPQNLFARALQQESSFDPEVIAGRKRSAADAIGIAQIVRESHPDVDPTDPAASIDYGAKYLRELYDEFGTWEEALAAYNWGPGNLREKGMINAPGETRRHVAAIMGDMQAPAEGASANGTASVRGLQPRRKEGETYIQAGNLYRMQGGKPKLVMGPRANDLAARAGSTAATGNASPDALAYLRAHPDAADQFKAKYGYLPPAQP